LSTQTEITAERGNNFWFHSSIAFNVLHELPEAVVVVVPAEFLFDKEYGLPRHTKTTAKKGYNILHEFQEAVVVVAPPESLVVEEYGLPRQTETTAKKGYNFLSDRWIALKLLQ